MDDDPSSTKNVKKTWLLPLSQWFFPAIAAPRRPLRSLLHSMRSRSAKKNPEKSIFSAPTSSPKIGLKTSFLEIHEDRICLCHGDMGLIVGIKEDDPKKTGA